MKNLVLIVLSCLFLSGGVFSQDLSNLRGTTPFRITGSIGTNNTFYHSSNPFQMRSPLANTLFANLNLEVYGFQIPLSFHMSNDNTNFSHPFARFGMSPRYRNLQLHMGYRSMNFSPFTYQNRSFYGAGLDFNWRLLRFSIFSGSLNQAREFSLEEQQPMQRPISYHRQAYGVKLGIGNARNYFDLILFNARDDTLSINPALGQYLQPKENLVLGTSFRFSLGNRISISSNIAASAYNDNMRSKEIEIKELDWMNDYYTPRFGSVVRLAGDVRAQINLGGVNTMLQYRLIQPGFNSLGTSYLANNLQQMGVSFNTSLFANSLSTNVSLFYQEDNVTKTQLYTNTGIALNVNANARFSDKFLLTTNYNTFSQLQQDGTAMVNDSTRLHRVMHNLALMPAYTFTDNLDRTHSFNTNFNASVNMNRNQLLETASDHTTFSGGAGYNILFDVSKINLMTNYSYQQSSSDHFSYNAHNVSIGGGKRFLEEGNLGVNVNSNFSLGQMDNGGRNLSVMTGVNASFTWKKNHTANIRFNFSHINNYRLDGLYSITGYDATVSMGYTYRFAPRRPDRNTNR